MNLEMKTSYILIYTNQASTSFRHASRKLEFHWRKQERVAGHWWMQTSPTFARANYDLITTIPRHISILYYTVKIFKCPTKL